MSMRRILLPEPPPPFAAAAAVPEIFGKGQQSSVVRRAVIIGNGLPGAEGQSMGLLRTLGLGSSVTLHRVTRPTGVLNEYLRFLPISFHKRLDRYLLRAIIAAGRLLSLLLKWMGIRKLNFHPSRSSSDTSIIGMSSMAPPGWLRDRGEVDPILEAQPILSLVPPPVEADAQQIAVIAKKGMGSDEGPLLVVACGRDTATVAATIKRLAGSAAFVVQISQPRASSGLFDLLVTPQHDFYALSPQGQQETNKWIRPLVTPPPPHRNVVLTRGSLHMADAAMLRSQASLWHNELGLLPKPLVVVNVGGPTRLCRYDDKFLLQLATTLVQLQQKSGGSVRLSFSRRTPTEMREYILDLLDGVQGFQIWHGEGPNPHFGHLAWGDAFVVTADSVTMISEACSTGKPVYIAGMECAKWKLAEFLRNLQKRGCIRPLSASQDLNEFWSYPPLRDDAEVGDRVRAELAKRGCVLPT